jgi:hypothetical protein
MLDWKDSQNSDGGWAWNRSGACSWTEPTVYALLAQTVTGVDRESFARGLNYLRSVRRSDGGWSPQQGVVESTWVTSLVAMLPEQAVGAGDMRSAIGWLKERTGRESGWTFRILQKLRGADESYPEGWPWFPGAAAWVIPTSMGILAFQRALARRNESGLRERVEAGREFLRVRVCADGGWNHGGNKALGRDGDSYPETTGIALLALRGAPSSPLVEQAKTMARRHLSECRGAEAAAWLRLGLASHGERQIPGQKITSRTTVDQALTTIAESAQNPFISQPA